MDGNGRWAGERGLPRSEGHRAGTESARRIVTECRRLGIAHLTLYTFSKENWKRPRDEVSFLFDLLVRFLERELSTLKAQNIRLNILGEWEGLPFTVRQVLRMVCSQTSTCDAMILNLALNYSGRQEILMGLRKMIESGLDPGAIDEEGFKRFLYTAGQPDPDLVIRTSGEQRLSNFLLYQSAYSELVFSPRYWPDFTEEDLGKALEEYGKRQRRFGDTQVRE
jgi:undecaprenyl diphosphate synthase